ncbi:uncharacterized protein BDR25DRAFT_361088 [Lindgomyces ingoldianus]|uniref:Uncharacterized protein n=1 Tax=Lindgomyces ingoldianus TaxID=673940 RepID=A0ACB6QD64_9PLEO|nr:uncharacterized protein BDR25DRAFT_361088 [Lindgomyces ingoldianus]KAF2464859.1 hypothetical protein BDR25DRAFT_361088 [Lindgomyces ingoldianus]
MAKEIAERMGIKTAERNPQRTDGLSMDIERSIYLLKKNGNESTLLWRVEDLPTCQRGVSAFQLIIWKRGLSLQSFTNPMDCLLSILLNVSLGYGSDIAPIVLFAINNVASHRNHSRRPSSTSATNLNEPLNEYVTNLYSTIIAIRCAETQVTNLPMESFHLTFREYTSKRIEQRKLRLMIWISGGLRNDSSQHIRGQNLLLLHTLHNQDTRPKSSLVFHLPNLRVLINPSSIAIHNVETATPSIGAACMPLSIRYTQGQNASQTSKTLSIYLSRGLRLSTLQFWYAYWEWLSEVTSPYTKCLEERRILADRPDIAAAVAQHERDHPPPSVDTLAFRKRDGKHLTNVSDDYITFVKTLDSLDKTVASIFRTGTYASRTGNFEARKFFGLKPAAYKLLLLKLNMPLYTAGVFYAEDTSRNGRHREMLDKCLRNTGNGRLVYASVQDIKGKWMLDNGAAPSFPRASFRYRLLTTGSEKKTTALQSTETCTIPSKWYQFHKRKHIYDVNSHRRGVYSVSFCTLHQDTVTKHDTDDIVLSARTDNVLEKPGALGVWIYHKGEYYTILSLLPFLPMASRRKWKPWSSAKLGLVVHALAYMTLNRYYFRAQSDEKFEYAKNSTTKPAQHANLSARQSIFAKPCIFFLEYLFDFGCLHAAGPPVLWYRKKDRVSGDDYWVLPLSPCQLTSLTSGSCGAPSHGRAGFYGGGDVIFFSRGKGFSTIAVLVASFFSKLKEIGGSCHHLFDFDFGHPGACIRTYAIVIFARCMLENNLGGITFGGRHVSMVIGLYFSQEKSDTDLGLRERGMAKEGRLNRSPREERKQSTRTRDENNASVELRICFPHPFAETLFSTSTLLLSSR